MSSPLCPLLPFTLCPHSHTLGHYWNSPTCLRHWWAAEHLSPALATTWQMSNGKSSPMFIISGLTHSYLHQQCRLYCAAQARVMDCVFIDLWIYLYLIVELWAYHSKYHIHIQRIKQRWENGSAVETYDLQSWTLEFDSLSPMQRTRNVCMYL